MRPLHQQRVLAFVPKYNSPGKKDVTGAFKPEARKLLKLSAGGTIFTFDNRKSLPQRRVEILKTLTDVNPDEESYDSVAFLCHGWMGGIQAGFLRAHVRALAEAISRITFVNGMRDAVVPLYCCSTGDDPQDDPLTAAGTGDDSFADKLRDAMCEEGLTDCRVMAHTTVAHATKNPSVLFMDGMGSEVGGVGGYPPVSPGSANWKRWKKKLRTTNLRFKMPFMTPAEIHAELSK